MASDSSILSREHHAGGIWPLPEGSDTRLPGGAGGGGGGVGGDAISGLDEQAHKGVVEGIHGSFPKGLLEEEEWYDGSLIDEMKDLSYPSSLGPPAPPHSHSQSHPKPESAGCFTQLDAATHSHPFVGRSSNNSSSSSFQERRSFSSFLDAPVPLDESSGMISAGFLSDFSAGLLPPHPPPPPPVVLAGRNGFGSSAGNGQHQLFNVSLGSSSQQQNGMFPQHTGFLADTLGNLGSSPMLDFSGMSPSYFTPGGFNSNNAPNNSGNFGNFSGIGSSLSIGMRPKNNGGVYGECFGEGLSSKEASFKGSCKNQQQQQQHTGSGQSSPSTIIKSPAFGSADSSLELGDDPATSPKRKNQKEKKSPASASEDIVQAVASAVDLDLREDDEMEDGSGLLCENDEAMGGNQKGPGGKGNRKGLPAKNLMAERRRRKKLNDRLYMLRSVVPKITKMDRASILGDAIEYLKELLQRINDLHTELEGPADAPMPQSPSPSLGGGMQQHPPLAPPMIPQTYPPCVKEECGGGATPAATMIAGPPPEMQPAKVDVRTRDGKTINIHMFCSKRPGLLLSTMRALDGLGLDVQQAVISCFNGFVLDVFRAEQFRDEIAAEEIKAVLLQTAACHDTIVPT